MFEWNERLTLLVIFLVYHRVTWTRPIKHGVPPIVFKYVLCYSGSWLFIYEPISNQNRRGVEAPHVLSKHYIKKSGNFSDQSGKILIFVRVTRTLWKLQESSRHLQCLHFSPRSPENALIYIRRSIFT